MGTSIHLTKRILSLSLSDSCISTITIISILKYILNIKTPMFILSKVGRKLEGTIIGILILSFYI